MIEYSYLRIWDPTLPGGSIVSRIRQIIGSGSWSRILKTIFSALEHAVIFIGSGLSDRKHSFFLLYFVISYFSNSWKLYHMLCITCSPPKIFIIFKFYHTYSIFFLIGYHIFLSYFSSFIIFFFWSSSFLMEK